MLVRKDGKVRVTNNYGLEILEVIIVSVELDFLALLWASKRKLTKMQLQH